MISLCSGENHLQGSSIFPSSEKRSEAGQVDWFARIGVSSSLLDDVG